MIDKKNMLEKKERRMRFSRHECEKENRRALSNVTCVRRVNEQRRSTTMRSSWRCAVFFSAIRDTPTLKNDQVTDRKEPRDLLVS